MQAVQAHPVLQSFIGRVLAEYWGKLATTAKLHTVAALSRAWETQ